MLTALAGASRADPGEEPNLQVEIVGLKAGSKRDVVVRVTNTSDWWSDYYDTPSKGLAPGELSVVVAEITVNKNGYFAGCTGHTYTGNPKMGPYVCSRLQMRAGFEPAHGPDGRKVIGVYRKLIIVANVTTAGNRQRHIAALACVVVNRLTIPCSGCAACPR